MKCKWRNVQKDLKTRKPQKVADMYHVLRCLFPMITDAEVTITEFHRLAHNITLLLLLCN